MNDQLQAALVQLAVKLGTTVEHVYEVMVRQAIVGSVGDLTVCLIFALGLGFTKSKTKDDLLIIWWAVAAFWIIFLACVLHSTITAIFNPEYWALQQVIGLLK